MKQFSFFIILFVLFTLKAKSDAWKIYVSPTSFMKNNLQSCYRWMSDIEKKKWLRKGPAMLAISKADWLGRDGIIKKGIFCWHHPLGAMRGGTDEIYGRNLVRIDFVDDLIIYDRSRQVYVNTSGNSVPENMKRSVDTEVFYANYNKGFQEYLIKDAKSIKGFTFNDPSLKEEFLKEADLFQKPHFEISNTHFFFTSFCPFPSSPEHMQRFFSGHNKLSFCYETRELAKKRKAHLIQVWEGEDEEWVSNVKKRPDLNYVDLP